MGSEVFVFDPRLQGRAMANTKSPRGGHTDGKAPHEGEPLSDSRKLDRDLDESFPGSDPVSVTQPTGKHRDDMQRRKD
jgi:hypothetical protein